MFWPNKDSLDQAREKAMNYSSSDDSNMNKVKKNVHTSCRKQLQKTISESDSDDTAIIPNPPVLTNNNVLQTVNKPSKNVNSDENVIDLDIIEGTLVSHKSNILFWFLYSKLSFSLVFIVLLLWYFFNVLGIQDLDEFMKKMSNKMEGSVLIFSL